ncbi:BESS motif,Somatomedin B domain [Cinara cedri]|uniref:BESS motif,Somatomedin B domain n=1 Tax=Cinara cedri TaxID=506608 RepID=A0A5E4NHE6_9HEMI|nr:BESS motif,Somatomedin B domain [Cinara cedri]
MTAATTGRCRNGLYSGNLNAFAVSAIVVVVVAATFVCAEKFENDLSGPLCAKINRCCDNRKDECSVPLNGTKCYCDTFCMNSTDCCPDYWTHCRNVEHPQQGAGKPEPYKELIANPESCDFGDELDLFFKCMAATVRKFPQRIIVETKIRIFQIVSQSERLNTTCSGVQVVN